MKTKANTIIIKLLSITAIIAICGYQLIMDFNGNQEHAINWIIMTLTGSLIVMIIMCFRINAKIKQYNKEIFEMREQIQKNFKDLTK